VMMRTVVISRKAANSSQFMSYSTRRCLQTPASVRQDSR
jgi:hypothetical protein